MSLKESILKIITPLIKNVAKDVESVKKELAEIKAQPKFNPTESVSTNIGSAPQYIGQIAVVDRRVYIATGNQSPSDWTQLFIGHE